MTGEKKQEATIIGTSYFNPIILLWKKLNENNFSGTSEIRKSTNENGYSCSIITLSIFCMESFITRMRYADKSDLEDSNETALHYFRSKFSAENLLCAKVSELFVLRDLIAHNHLWKINYELDKDYNEISINKKLFGGWGNNHFKNEVDISKEKTKTLELEIVPTKIGKEDAKKVLNVLKEFLDFISKQNKGYCAQQWYSELNETLEEK